MNQFFTKISYLLFFVILFTGCISKRYVKKAEIFESNGMFADATAMYMKAIKAKSTNIDARLGLKRSGQASLDRYLEDFSKSFSSFDYKAAISKYATAKTLESNLKQYNITLDFPEIHQKNYEEAKNYYLEDKYYEGQKLLNEQDFAKAATIFEEINKLSSGYKNVSELYKTAICEPLFRKGVQEMASKKYRTAFYTFNNIVEKYKTYKESVDLRDNALQKATLYITFENHPSNQKLNELQVLCQNEITRKVIESKHPFIKFVTTKTQDNGGNINKQLANAIFKGRMVAYNPVLEKRKNEIKQGYQKIETKMKSKLTGADSISIKYVKTEYNEISQRCIVFMQYQFALNSLDNGTILLNYNQKKEHSDMIRYAQYEGSFKMLIPGSWKSKTENSVNDKIDDYTPSIKELHSLFEARKELKSLDRMTNELVGDFATEIAKQLIAYNPEK